MFQLFEKYLNERGVIVFTAAGERVAIDLKNGGNAFGIDASGVASLLNDYGRSGFGFATYPKDNSYKNTNAGRSISSLAWVSNYLRNCTQLQVLGYFEGGWSQRQDIYVVKCANTNK